MDRELSTVGRYALLGRLASGGMGTVHRARAHGEGGFVRDFAVKILHPHVAENRDAVVMFLDEARLAARIQHTNVVTTFDAGKDGDRHYVVMELVDGASVADLLRHGAVAPGVAVRIMLDTLAGLAAAHAACSIDGTPLEIVHRDVSPANVLVGCDGIAKLTDFGIAKARERLRTTVAVEIKGKLGYMAPEQMDGGAVDARSDVFAAGVLLWELLRGESLLHGQRGRLKELEGHSAPAWFATGAGPETDAVVRRALRIDPGERFASAEAMAQALSRAHPDSASRAEVAECVFARRPAPVPPPADAASSQITADVTHRPAWDASAPPAASETEADTRVDPRRPRRGPLVAIALVGSIALAGFFLWRMPKGAASSREAPATEAPATEVPATEVPATERAPVMVPVSEPAATAAPPEPAATATAPEPAATATAHERRRAPRSRKPPAPVKSSDPFGGRR